MIEAADQVYVSVASIWEGAIKASLGRIDADANQLAAAIDPSGFVELPVTTVHVAGARRWCRTTAIPSTGSWWPKPCANRSGS